MHATFRYGLQTDVALAFGAVLSSIFSATLSHPMDTIKTCMQGDVGRTKYPGGAVDTGRVLAAEYGLRRGLFKGLTWRIVLITSTFFLVNKFKGVMVYQYEARASRRDIT